MKDNKIGPKEIYIVCVYKFIHLSDQCLLSTYIPDMTLVSGDIVVNTTKKVPVLKRETF